MANDVAQRKGSTKRKHADPERERLKEARLSPEELSEDEKNLRAWAATEKLIKSGITIKDVFGRLDGN